MKTILRQFLNQHNAMNGRGIAIEGRLRWMKESPVLFLWGVWAVYLGLDLLIRYIGSLGIAPIEIILWNFFGWGLINQFWFFVFLPNVVFFRRFKLEVALFVGAFLTFVLIKLFLLGKWSQLDWQLLPFLANESVRSLQFLLYTSAIWGFYVLAVSQDEFNRMEVDLIKLRVEHKSLQLSPHFVLNMVSQFSAAVLALSRPLFESLSRFTEVLAYSYKSLDQPNSLAQEIHAMESYIACQRERFGDRLQFILTKELGGLQVNSLSLPKWTLMTLLENVFKHGDCFDPSRPCRLGFRVEEHSDGNMEFSMSLANPIDLATPPKSSEFGMEAVRHILDYHFPGSFRMNLEKTQTDFKLLLYISYGKNSENRALG